MTWGELLALGVVCALTSWRISSMLYGEQMFDWLRQLLGVGQTDEYDWDKWQYPQNIIGDTLSCFWCLSLAMSFPIALIATLWLRLDVLQFSLLWLGTSTLAIMIERWIGRSKARF
jgi:fucose 4-O-acetylase-like acetyltransferase